MAARKTVFVIEDDRFLSSLIKARLEKDGYAVIQAFDGEEGLNALKQAKTDIIVLDLILPKMSGFEVLEAISTNPLMNRIPLIILSNLAQESDILKAKQFGATEYFVKVKVSIDDLVNKINSILK